MEPAHRKEVRQPGAPHRLCILLGQRALVTGRERRGDGALRLFQPAPDMLIERRPQRGQALLLTGAQDFHHSECPAGRSKAGEPGVARIIMRPGKRHRHRRREARAQPDDRAAAKALRHLLVRHVDSKQRRQRRVAGLQHQPKAVPRGELLDPLNLRLELNDGRALQPRGRDPSAPKPDEGRSERHHRAEDRDGPPQPPGNEQAA